MTFWRWIPLAIGLALLLPLVVSAAVAPLSQCYSIGTDDQLYDLTSFYGHEFSMTQGQKNYTLRFCKDFQERSVDGFISFGSFETGISYNSAPSGTSFLQEYMHGDLRGCEYHGTEFDGREAEVSVICGNSCPSRRSCTDSAGCICSVTLDGLCMASVVLTLPCPDSGPQVVKGFTVGFSPRGSEVVSDGLTQWGYESDEHEDYSFGTAQSKVFLYFSAPIQMASKIGKPSFSQFPSKGLGVQLSSTGGSGEPATTLAPGLLEVIWQCEAEDKFVVNFTIPVDGYDPIAFSLSKLCEYSQKKETSASNGWATFGVLSLIFFVLTSTCCCGGFLYGTRVEHKRGLEALPAIGLLSGCLDAVSGGDTGGGYQRANEVIGDRPLRDGSSPNSRGMQRGSDGRYGSV